MKNSGLSYRYRREATRLPYRILSSRITVAPVIFQAYFHVGAEYAVLHNRNGFPCLCNHVFIQIFCKIRLTGFYKAWSVSFLQLAYRVNCETRSNSPPMSARERFVFLAVLKNPKSQSFSNICPQSPWCRFLPTPTSTRKPFLMLPTISLNSYAGVIHTLYHKSHSVLS